MTDEALIKEHHAEYVTHQGTKVRGYTLVTARGRMPLMEVIELSTFVTDRQAAVAGQREVATA